MSNILMCGNNPIGQVSDLNAASILYNNTSSGLTAADVQAAIDEINLKNGGTINNDLNIVKTNTATSLGSTQLTIGNTIPEGTAGNSKGILALTAANDKWCCIESVANRSRSSTAYLPNESGTVALAENVVAKSGDTMTGNLIINHASETTANQDSIIVAGNEIPAGTVGNATGVLQLWSRGDKCALLYPSTTTDNVSLSLPTRSGTMNVDTPLVFSNANNVSSTTFTMNGNVIYFVSTAAVGGNGSQFLDANCYLVFISNRYNEGTVTYARIVEGTGPRISAASIDLSTGACTLTFSTAARFVIRELWTV